MAVCKVHCSRELLYSNHPLSEGNKTRPGGALQALPMWQVNQLWATHNLNVILLLFSLLLNLYFLCLLIFILSPTALISLFYPPSHDQKYSVLPSYSHTYPNIFKLFKQHISVPRDSDLQVVIYFGPSAISFP